jgi:outer membrane protein OmpA-like peptidoglycan-associated protein
MTSKFRISKKSRLIFVMLAALCVSTSVAFAQDVLPYDNGLATYHTAPRYRESESHPLRIVGYILHPIGWVAREVVFRPLSYFASSSETRRSVMGYREPYDYRQPECFSADDSVPDCKTITPFNYEQGSSDTPDEASKISAESGQVYFPNVNFDFNVRKLNALGKGRVKQIAEMLATTPSLKVVLQGHADYVGSEQYNEKLGMDRAQAVKDELVGLGVSAERLSTVSFGETQPIHAEQEDWARAINRRVEVHGDASQPESAK